MTIQEQLIKLNKTFEKMHHDFTAVEDQQKNLESKYDNIRSAIKDKYQLEYGRKNQLKEEVLKYFRIAKDNSPKELIYIGITPLHLNLAKLNGLVEQINVHNRLDAAIGQIIDLAKAYVASEEELDQLSKKSRINLRTLIGIRMMNRIWQFR
ncbi:MAG: hypothetical protein NC124_08760 [Clostridium sp.]|nr:hypothetical protein [Clostridium sp.]